MDENKNENNTQKFKAIPVTGSTLYDKTKKTKSGFGKSVIIPFISGVLGCTVVIGTCFGIPSIKTKIIGSSNSSSISTTNNTSTKSDGYVKQTSLENYSDTSVQCVVSDGYTSKTINFTHIYLNDLEINSLYELVLTPEMRKENKIGKESHIEESKDLFIISARTGLRFSDLRHIGSATWDMSEGKETLTILIQKTNDRLSIPLHKQVIEIYEKYKGVLPLPVDKSKYNEHVRLCAKLAGITENIATFEWEKGRPVMKDHKKYELISSHTGRRSFATNLYLVCKSPHYVMNLTGHQTEENFKRYICVDQKEMAEVVRKYINLDYNGEGDEDFERFVRALKQDTRTIDQQQEEIAQLQKEVQSTKQMAAISEMQRQDAETEVEEQKEAWGMGLSLGDYEDLKRQGDVIAAATDQQPDD